VIRPDEPNAKGGGFHLVESGEGSSRSSGSDYARFVEISAGSLFEVISQATISRRQGFLSETDFN